MVGTLTVHYNSNYGANLQAYALRTFLSQKYNGEVRLIDYRNDFIRNLYALRPWDIHSSFPYVTVNTRSIKRSIKILLNVKGTIIRDRKFEKFRLRYIPMTKTVYDIKGIIELGCDIIIIGSDQIWNNSITEDKEKAYWGSMKKDSNHIASYAPSFGRTELSDIEYNNVKTCLSNFDYITVREPSMIDIISSYTNKEIHTVCDPVFLLTKTEWKQLIQPKDGNYILVYLVENNPDVITIAEYISKLLKKQVLILSVGKKITKTGGKYLKSADPIDFLSYFVSADYVITNSFHGTAFSLLFNKQFLTIPDTKKPTRMVELLNRCYLSDRICYDSKEFNEKIVLQNISFEIANNVIEEIRKDSIHCIEEILDYAEDTSNGN